MLESKRTSESSFGLSDLETSRHAGVSWSSNIAYCHLMFEFLICCFTQLIIQKEVLCDTKIVYDGSSPTVHESIGYDEIPMLIVRLCLSSVLMRTNLNVPLKIKHIP